MKMRCLKGSASQSDIRSVTRVQEWLFSKYWNPREGESLEHLPVRQTTLLPGHFPRLELPPGRGWVCSLCSGIAFLEKQWGGAGGGLVMNSYLVSCDFL